MTQTRAVEAWTLRPLERFVAEAGARLTLLMTPAGQVLAQHGFTRAVDVMSAAALGAAIVASSGELATMLRQKQFSALNHQGVEHGIFLGAFDTPRGRLLALVVYGPDSSVGLVQLFFEEFVTELAAAAPAEERGKAVLAADFERELNESLATLFGQ
ncbi:MAG: roadblock/LC7 domain-containing protein [Gemmatimonadota bacterium]|nr:MAG: roadblock/LC7 domain-containing protein [Gemmatimonadota bacterium]